MLSWLPIIGPIIQGITGTITSIFTSKSNQEIEATKASVQVIQATEGDIGVRLARDLIMFPVAVVMALYSWNLIVTYTYPTLVWKIGWYQGNLEYLPYAVLMFLFGHTAMAMWGRK